jgi:hypothetical protein
MLNTLTYDRCSMYQSCCVITTYMTLMPLQASAGYMCLLFPQLNEGQTYSAFTYNPMCLYRHPYERTHKRTHLSWLAREVIPDIKLAEELLRAALIKYVTAYAGAPQAEDGPRLQLIKDSHPAAGKFAVGSRW